MGSSLPNAPTLFLIGIALTLTGMLVALSLDGRGTVASASHIKFSIERRMLDRWENLKAQRFPDDR